MEIKSVNPKLRQDRVAKEPGCSSSTLQCYRHDKNMLLAYRIPTNSYKRGQEILKTNLDDN